METIVYYFFFYSRFFYSRCELIHTKNEIKSFIYLKERFIRKPIRLVKKEKQLVNFCSFRHIFYKDDIEKRILKVSDLYKNLYNFRYQKKRFIRKHFRIVMKEKQIVDIFFSFGTFFLYIDDIQKFFLKVSDTQESSKRQQIEDDFFLISFFNNG